MRSKILETRGVMRCRWRSWGKKKTQLHTNRKMNLSLTVWFSWRRFCYLTRHQLTWFGSIAARVLKRQETSLFTANERRRDNRLLEGGRRFFCRLAANRLGCDSFLRHLDLPQIKKNTVFSGLLSMGNVLRRSWALLAFVRFHCVI